MTRPRIVLAVLLVTAAWASTGAAQIGGRRAIRARLPALQPEPLVALAVDIDLDGDQDLLVGCADRVVVWRNAGDAVFEDRSAVAWPSGLGGARELHRADIDSDSRDEILMVSPDGLRLTWVDAVDEGRFRELPSSTRAPAEAVRGSAVPEPLSGRFSGPFSDAALIDLDGDTHRDVLLLRGAGRAPGLRLCDGRGGFTAWRGELPRALHGGVALARGTFTGRVEPELLVASAEGGLTLARFQPEGTAQRIRVVTEQLPGLPERGLEPAPRGLLAADLDGDGDCDVLLRDRAGQLHAYESLPVERTWREATAHWLLDDLPPVAELIEVALLGAPNTDQGDEVALLAATPDGACFLLRRANRPGYRSGIELLPGSADRARGPVRLLAADFDRDGCQDLLLVGPRAGLELWLARPRRTADGQAWFEAATSAPR